jgi:hypothetical protein
MGRIDRVHPGSGKAGDKITIRVLYDKKLGDNTKVTHVLFYDNAEAPNLSEIEHDKANRNITISVDVPRNAETGPIEVNLEGDEPFRTVEVFTVEAPDKIPFKVTQIKPQLPAEGYEQGWKLWITTSRTKFNQTQPKVYFPTTSYGPPTQAARIMGTNAGTVTVFVPTRSQSGSIMGRIKVQDGAESAYTRVLKLR